MKREHREEPAQDLAFKGVSRGPGRSLVVRFDRAGEPLHWRIEAASYAEFLALLLGGRLGRADAVVFDEAAVSFEEARDDRPRRVSLAIDGKVRILAPCPTGEAAGDGPAVQRSARRSGA